MSDLEPGVILSADTVAAMERLSTSPPMPGDQPMTPLSSAAQAVLDACNEAVERLPLTAEPEQFSVALIAAALRAAADQVVPEVKSPGGCREGERQCVRRELLAIAAELGGGTTTPTES